MKAVSLLGLSIWLLVGAQAAQANDSSAEMSVGGLTFTRNADVSMESEDLSITMEHVNVRYVFLNQSQSPVTLTVAFPLPDIDLTDADNVAIPGTDPANFVDFQTRIDGKPVKFEIVQRAFLGTKDVSQAVRAAGLPILPLGDHQERIAALPENTRARLIADGLLEPVGTDERDRKIYGGSWTVKTSVVRQQVFPPGKPVTVEHRYRTSVGMSLDTVLRSTIRQSRGMQQEFQRYRTDYCVTDDLLKSVDRLAGTGQSSAVPLQERRISYILKTGANWAGPIKDFRLVVDKGRADRLISFCGEGVKRISPTSFEMRARNFTPDRDLKILIVGKRD